jgi:hypothetical protein
MKNQKTKQLFILFLVIVFFIGLYLYVNKTFTKTKKETFNSAAATSGEICPNMLVKSGNNLVLYSSTDQNFKPIFFNNLDEYIIYANKQKMNGKECPILFIQQETDVQGNDMYRIRPSPFDLQGGNQIYSENIVNKDSIYLPVVDANREHPPFNAGNYPGFDPTNNDVGKLTEIDKVHYSTEINPVNQNLSENPMDSNWGGVLFTQSLVDSGKYEDYNIYKPNYITPKN